MLNRHAVSPLARRLGGLLLLLVGLLGGGAVHALRATEMPEASPASTGAANHVDLTLKLSMFTTREGKTRLVETNPRLRLQPGSEAKVIMNGSPDQPTPEQVVINIKVTPLSGGRWQLDLQLAQGLPLQLLSKPRLIVMEGEPGRVEVRDTTNQQLSLTVTARRAAAAATT